MNIKIEHEAGGLDMTYRFPGLELLELYNPENNFTNMEYVKTIGGLNCKVFWNRSM